MNMIYQPSAFIASPLDKGRKKIYLNENVYLENKSEFLIELFNPLAKSVLAEIKINGTLASANGLVLKPGQRVYIDCFINDKRKFVFETYEVDNTQECLNAIALNGVVDVSFYKETSGINYRHPFNGINYRHPFNGINIINNTVTQNPYTTAPFTPQWNEPYWVGMPTTCCVSTSVVSANSMETGRVEKGEQSSQIFNMVNGSFDNIILNKVVYKLLPESRKPIDADKIKNSNFCANCGYPNKNYKFCPTCGNKY